MKLDNMEEAREKHLVELEVLEDYLGELSDPEAEDPEAVKRYEELDRQLRG